MASGPTWEIGFTAEAEQWLKGLPPRQANQIVTAIDQLRQIGPTLGRERVDSIRGSRHHNMKELRSVGGHLRALFAFDRNRHGVILVGGDKTNDWKGWYKRNIPLADKLYDEHLRSNGKEPPWRARTRPGERSAESSR